MTFGELLATVIGLMDRAGIPYMVTGSLASSYHGEPRATRDVDIVVDPDRDRLATFVEMLAAAGFYVDRDTALDALVNRTQFNAIGPDASKVDFIIRRDRPFPSRSSRGDNRLTCSGRPASSRPLKTS